MTMSLSLDTSLSLIPIAPIAVAADSIVLVILRTAVLTGDSSLRLGLCGTCVVGAPRELL